MAVEDAPLASLPDWTLQDWIYCSTGPLQGQVYTLEQWRAKARAQERMRDVGNSSGYGPLDYVITVEEVEHPSYRGRGVVGRKAVLDPASNWKPVKYRQRRSRQAKDRGEA